MRPMLAVLALSIGAAAQLPAQQPLVRGVVFADANGNGSRDRGERGLRGIVVSNQDEVVTTDSSGTFSIDAGTTGIAFVSVPDGYRAVGSFWRKTDTAAPLEFALRPTAKVTQFSFVHASDTHIAPAVVNRMRRFRALTDSLRPAFALIAGDLIRDAMSQSDTVALSYYDLFVTETKPFVTPLWLVPGNHENFGINRLRSTVPQTHPLYGRRMYHQYFGPDYYSFTYGGIHFVGLNSVSIDDSAYFGEIDSVQIAWLKRDLAHVPRDMPIVTFNHIPLVSGWETLTGYIDQPPVSSVKKIKDQYVFRHTVWNVAELMDVLAGRPYPLALGAHIHEHERLTYEMVDRTTRFEQSAAIVAPGEMGSMKFPSGFTLYTVRNGKIDAGRFIPLVMGAGTSQ